MSFVLYDLTFLVVFTLAVVLFLYTHRAKLQRQGVLYLYRTSIGLKIIETTSKKYAKILKPLQYVVVATGYLLMGLMIYFLVTLVKLYTSNAVVRETKIPPILPLIPYLPDLFKVDFLPPFYFTYWILIIAVVAIVHEFAHGIYARYYGIKVHATGFGFLGPFLAAFVEPDEKHMQKAKKFPQLVILGAGVFTNIIVAFLFLAVMWAFFSVSFVPAGVNFNAYGTSVLNLDDIQSINGLPLSQAGIFAENDSLQRIFANNQSYLTSGVIFSKALEQNAEAIIVYDDAPAINAQFKGPILAVDNEKIENIDSLREILSDKLPGETIEILTIVDDEKETILITLDEKDGNAYLGIGIRPPRGKLIGAIYFVVSKIKDPFVYYEPLYGDFAVFIYDFLWWMVIINFSVALMNMLPVGIFDGGRFFYLTIWGLTGREKWGKWAFAIATYAILAVFVWMTLRWVWVFF
ncbi:MAG: site-2 protease family protein [Nanoarchaeota archaeon]